MKFEQEGYDRIHLRNHAIINSNIFVFMVDSIDHWRSPTRWLPATTDVTLSAKIIINFCRIAGWPRSWGTRSTKWFWVGQWGRACTSEINEHLFLYLNIIFIYFRSHCCWTLNEQRVCESFYSLNICSEQNVIWHMKILKTIIHFKDITICTPPPTGLLSICF